MTLEDLQEAWRVNQAVTMELLAAIADEDFDLKPGKGKTIRSNFVHLAGVRRIWLEERMSAEAANLPRPDWKSATRAELEEALVATSELMNRVFEKMEARTKPGRFTTLKFFAYAIAHEAHHRSQIELTLRLNGKEPEDAFLFGLWDWSKK